MVTINQCPTVREEFIKAAMQALLSNPVVGDSNLHDTSEEWLNDVAECAVEFADRQLRKMGEFK